MQSINITQSEFLHGSTDSTVQDKINSVLKGKCYFIIHLGLKEDSDTDCYKRFYWDSVFPLGTLRGTTESPLSDIVIKDVIQYCIRKDYDIIFVSTDEEIQQAQKIIEEITAAANAE